MNFKKLIAAVSLTVAATQAMAFDPVEFMAKASSLGDNLYSIKAAAGDTAKVTDFCAGPFGQAHRDAGFSCSAVSIPGGVVIAGYPFTVTYAFGSFGFGVAAIQIEGEHQYAKDAKRPLELDEDEELSKAIEGRDYAIGRNRLFHDVGAAMILKGSKTYDRDAGLRAVDSYLTNSNFNAVIQERTSAESDRIVVTFLKKDAGSVRRAFIDQKLDVKHFGYKPGWFE